MQKLFRSMTENDFSKLTSVMFLAVFAICVVTGDRWLDWLSWFVGVASGVSIWKLIFKR